MGKRQAAQGGQGRQLLQASGRKLVVARRIEGSQIGQLAAEDGEACIPKPVQQRRGWQPLLLLYVFGSGVDIGKRSQVLLRRACERMHVFTCIRVCAHAQSVHSACSGVPVPRHIQGRQSGKASDAMHVVVFQ